MNFSIRALFLSLWFFPTAQADTLLGIDELTNRGATRNIALAGATAAFPNNHSAFIENPASIPFQPALVNLSFANAAVNDSRFKSIGSDIIVDKRNEFEGGLALRLFEVIGLGGGIVTESYRLEREASQSNPLGVDVMQTTFPISASAHVFNELSIGLSYNLHMAEITRLADEEAAGSLKKSASSKYSGNTFKLSGLYVANANLAVALTHQLEQTLTASHSDAPALRKPSKTQIAAVYFIPPFGTESGPFTENTIAAQIDIVTYQNEGDIFHPAVYLWQSLDPTDMTVDDESDPSDAKVVRGPRYIPKLGVETLLFRQNNFEGQMWLGSYWEPALYSNDDSRTHMTGGLELSAWFVVLRYALDVAERYKNQSLGVGVALQF